MNHIVYKFKDVSWNVIVPQVLLLTLLLNVSIYSQSSTATLSGTVEDEKGGVIPGAAVTIVNVGTGARRNTTTNDRGSFNFPLLSPSTYTLTVERTGFGTAQFPDIVLNVGDQKALQVQLKVGQVGESVEVRPDESLINTSPAVTNTIDRTFVQNLPVNGRSFQSLILLTPGVTVAPANNANPGTFSVNGSRTNTNVFTVDGVSANTGIQVGNAQASQLLGGSTPGVTATGGTNGMVSMDALEEFKIQTSTYTAEYGRQPGGQITLVTRAGKNQFHGSAFEYFRNEKLDANDWFANAQGKGRAELSQNIFGGTFSGPVFLPRFGEGGPLWYNGRNKTFFFFSYEGTRLLQPQTLTVNVPSLRLRNSAHPGLRPFLNAFPIPTTPELLTTTACVQPTDLEAQNPQCSGTLSSPNGFLFAGASPFSAVWSDPSRADIAGLRLDHNLTSNISLFGRYNRVNSENSARNQGVSNGLVTISDERIATETLTIGSTWVFTSSISNEFRFNRTIDRVSRITRMDGFGGGTPVALSNLIPGQYSQGTGVFGNVGFTVPAGTLGFGIGQNGNNITQNQLNIVENLTWVKGSHNLKFGVDLRRLRPVYSPRDYFLAGVWNGETQIQSGIAGSFITTVQKELRPVYTNLSFYGQDTWKLSPRLTLDLGLRWEINPAPSGDAKKMVTIRGIENLATATLAPLGTPMYKTDYTAFAPRFGLAWQISDTKGWERVVRGGFGVYYDLGSGNALTGAGQFPLTVTRNTPNTPFPFSLEAATPPVLPTTFTLPITSTLNAFDSNFKLPYTLQWNLSVEQSLGPNHALTLSYVAAAGRRLVLRETVNSVATGVARVNPNFQTNLFYISNRPTSDYNSLQAQFRRRLTHGLQVLINYTWAHAIDEASDETGGGTSAVLERGNADFDIRHNFSAAVTYELPGQHLGNFLGVILGGWYLDGIVHTQSAQPLNLQSGLPAIFILEDGRAIARRPDLIPGQPLYIKDPSVPSGRRINPAAFAAPTLPAGSLLPRQGTLGRNVLRALPLYQLDLGLRRKFTVREKFSLQFKAEAYNILNRPNFGNFQTNISVPTTLGVPSQMLGRSLGGLSPLYQIGGPRSMQLSMRLEF